ncbi:MAG: polyprenyl synthetase family protein [Christensenellales bacterium]|jgi:geranylgeranyl diphosphate synthase type II
MTFEEMQKDYVDAVNGALDVYLADGRIHPRLAEAMAYSVTAGGKRLRACLLLAACELAGGSVQEALPFAAAVEMIHTYSLIHDDLPAMDNDCLRRGKPTNHVVFGEGMAILAGDGLLNYAMQVMLNAALADETGNALRAANEIAGRAGVWGMIAGQAEDLLAEGREPDEKTLYYIHAHKTADMLLASLRAGGMIGGADDTLMRTLTVYGEKLGLAFQIQDDLLDLFGNEASLGKSIGKDAKQSKLTFPALYGAERAQRMQEQYCKEAAQALSGFNAPFLTEMAARLAKRER